MPDDPPAATAVAPVRPTRVWSRITGPLLLVVALGWLVAAFNLFYESFVLIVFGPSWLNKNDYPAPYTFVSWPMALLVLPPLACLLVAAATGRRAAAVTFGCLLGLGVVAGFVQMNDMGYQPTPAPAPVTATTPTQCVPYSGAVNDCPGG